MLASLNGGQLVFLLDPKGRGKTMTMAVDSVRAADMDAFIARWQASGGAERANYQLFLTGLCDLLDLLKDLTNE